MPTKTTSKKTPPATPAAPPEPPAEEKASGASPAISEPAAEELNDLQLVLKTKVTLDDTSLTLAGDTTFTEWQEVYAFAEKLNERGKWWLGDIIKFAEGKFPDRYTQAIEVTGLSYSRLTTIVSVCGRIEPTRRRKEAKFSFHELIAYLPYQTGDHLLDRAIKEKWSHEQLADAVARSKGEPTKAERRAAKESKKGGSLPKKANDAPPTLDGHVTIEPKALIWNGYPLAVDLTTRRIYQGPERLPEDEADRAAHHHQHAHGPALASWLEEHGFTRKEGDEPCAIATRNSESTCASNGASVVPSDAAPKSQAEKLTDEQIEEFLKLIRERQSKMTVEELVEQDLKIHQRFGITPAPAPSAPPAAPETPKTADIPIDHEATKEIVFDTLRKIGEPVWNLDAECRLIDAVDYLRDRVVALGIERDDARDQLKRFETLSDMEAKKPALERAEAAILAFNEASREVDWSALTDLQRKKWLSNLLRRADDIIDTIQNQPIKPRK